MGSHPYFGCDFFSFFSVLFYRFWMFVTGRLPFESLASDEIQLVVLMAVAISGALVGTFLVLRKMTMLANALSHTVLLGIVVVYLLCQTLSVPALLLAALLSGIVTTFLTEFLTRVIKLQEDASIGLIFSILFALGIVLVSLFSRNGHIGTELVMGNVDALRLEDIKLVFAMLGMNALLFFLFYRGFKITTFDPLLARFFGFSPLLFNYLLMVQSSLTLIGAFRAVGVLMILAFLVLPTLTARLMTHDLPKLVGLSLGLGSLASLIGVALSRHMLSYYGIGLSTGGIVVIVLGIFYLITIGAYFMKSLIDNSKLSGYDLAANHHQEENETNSCTG